MQPLSVFEMFKIGVGPSSSHTLGPWIAANRFICELPNLGPSNLTGISVELFGSLAKTGKGHGTDIAVQLGLLGRDPKTIDVDSILPEVARIKEEKKMLLGNGSEIPFNPKADIQFHWDVTLQAHPNGMRFTALFDGGEQASAVYYSIGGGFIVQEGEVEQADDKDISFPIDTAEQMLDHCRQEDTSISGIVLQNEHAWRSQTEIEEQLAEIKDTMIACAHRGCRVEGILPGGLNVKRRASRMMKRLLGRECPEDIDEWIGLIREQDTEFDRVMDYVSCFALAVNEENAAFGRVVTAPTNGAAGVIPAVLLYFLCFCDRQSKGWLPFLLTAGEIGCIFKKQATISAAMGGCQAEIGVSSAMAAAALTECLGGSAEQAARAAEIAMEHHLGLTCDPVGGLVQIPCIERNAMGAIKAIMATRISLQRDASEACVSLDAVIRSMWETAQDMNAKYKETSEGGLAVQIPVSVSEC